MTAIKGQLTIRRKSSVEEISLENPEDSDHDDGIAVADADDEELMNLSEQNSLF